MDENYIRDLRVEIAIKSANAAMLMQEVEFLKTILSAAEAGHSQEEIRKALERNPFDDFDIFGMRKKAGKP